MYFYFMNKLLQINTTVNSGSTGKIAEELGAFAINQDWESYIAYGIENNRPSLSNKIRIGSDLDIYMHGVRTRIFDNHSLGRSSRKATKGLIEKMDEIKPDLIHLHNLHGYYLNVDVLFNYLKTLDKPIVWTLHDCWAFTGHCSYFSLVGCDKWKTHCHNCPITNRYPASYMMDRSEKNFDDKRELFNSLKNLTLVPVSDWLGDLLPDSFLSALPVKVIHNGIDTNIFKSTRSVQLRDKYGIGNKFMMIAVATTWDRRKGLQDYHRLAERLDDSCQLVFIGMNKGQIRKLPNNIIGIERTENTEELVEFYSEADVVMNISYAESFGLTTVEGFACGTPGIVYNATASPELITPDTGIVVKKGDIEALHKAVLEIKSKGKAFYSQACIERVNHFYNKEDRYSDYLNLYNSLIKKSADQAK